MRPAGLWWWVAVGLVLGMIAFTPKANAGTRIARENRHTFHELFPNVDGGSWDCVNSLYKRESGWHHRARSGPIGATHTDYGIPQLLLPKFSNAQIRDWLRNPTRQLKAGDRYVASRYGSYCAAWNHSQGTGWY